jgi:CubicO group peptidase (beta-lactamase class C family)
MPRSRRAVALLCALGLLTGCVSVQNPTTAPSPTDSAKADSVMTIVRDTMASAHLKSVIVRVTIDGQDVVTQAVGESMTGVPATTGMHFRNGAVAISYVSTLLLKLVDAKKVALDDKLSKWLPNVPNSDRESRTGLPQLVGIFGARANGFRW